MKKFISLIMSVFILFVQSIVLLPAFQAKSQASTEENKLGDNIIWSVDKESSTLYVSGQGEGYDYMSDTAPSLTGIWDGLENLVISEGITYIGAYTFMNCEFETVSFPATLVHVGLYAFTGAKNIEDFIIPENSELRYYNGGDLSFTKYYKYLEDGPIYLGNLLYSIKGKQKLTDYTLVIKEGTRFISASFCYANPNIVDVVFPDSIEYIGPNALKNTTWHKNLPNGPVYAGKVLYEYIGEVSEDDSVFYVKEGTWKIGKEAFEEKKGLKEIYFPASLIEIEDLAFNCCSNLIHVGFAENGSLKTIGRWAFDDCDRLKEIDIPKTVTYIGDFAFCRSGIKEFFVPSGVEHIGESAFRSDYAEKITVDEKNAYFCSGDYGELFSKDKTKLLCVPVYADTDLYVVPDSVKFIGNLAFSYCTVKNIIIGDNVEDLGISAFSYSKAESIKLGKGIDSIKSSTFYYCWKLNEIVIPENVKSIETNAFSNAYNLTKAVIYSQSTEFGKNAFYNNANNFTIYCYKDSDAHMYATENSFSYIVLEDLAEGDYSILNGVIEQVKKIDRSIYTEESLAKLDEIINGIDYSLKASSQSEIDAYVNEMNTAISNLEYLPADYSAVEDEISKANAIDRRYYSEISLISLDAAINSVDYSLNITEQDKVNGYAQAIANAISALEYASIVLRHEPCGVIVSATTKEIKPDTLLAVEEVDPSNYEGTNFAVGGSIRSLHFYDINLVYETVIVQPDGTVTVKIKLADGVDPAKCKVYHVTEDIVNPLVRFASTIDGNYIVFETDHFSEFAVIEVETVLDSIEISTHPAKTEYIIGEQLDLTGMKVVAYYSDGTSKEVSDYNAGIVDMQTAGTKKVTVYYTFGTVTKSTDFNITVTGETKNVADIIIRSPSITTIKYGDSIWLHAKIEGELPSDAKIVWIPNNNNFEVVEVSADGMSCKITPKSSGTTTFTVSVVATDENVLATDSQDMTSKAGLWQKIVAFFKKIFGAAKTYPELYKKLF